MKHLLLFLLSGMAGLAPALGQKDTVLDVRQLEKDLAPIPGLSVYQTGDSGPVLRTAVYMYRYEISNYMYRLFLRDLEHRHAGSQLEMARVDESGWKQKLAYGEPYQTYYFSHPAFAGYPVVNVTQAGALLFCDWLTEQYNAYAKRKFKNARVTFRLPTEQEWITAARGGNPNAIYPWNGPYIRGGKGDFLCNFSPVGEENIYRDTSGQVQQVPFNKRALYASSFSLSDNADITAPVKSYFPNAYGLYNMSGNAAEMLMEQGHTKGGSWGSTGYEVRIDAHDPYAGITGPSPYIGFRVVMVVEFQ